MGKWLDPFQADEFGYDAFFDTIGTVILGRTTYEQIRGFGDSDHILGFQVLQVVISEAKPLGIDLGIVLA